MSNPQDANAIGTSAHDADSQETREWMDALSAVIEKEGAERAHFLLGAVAGARPRKQH
jgi:pyruvate dehydrogenase E1 component